MAATSGPRPDYGIDAPRAVSVLVALGAAAGLAALGMGLALPGPLGGLAAVALGVLAADLLTVAVTFLWYSRAGKLRQRDRLLGLICWRGDETVLDIGCGRGLLLIAAAQRLSSGRAVGVDIWSRVDLSGNRPEATRENARRAGVDGRVEVRDGDARSLPFDDATFDVVVSSLVLHNISDREERRQAVREIARVLKPGGRVALLDLRHTGDYVRELRQCSLAEACRIPAGFLFTWLFPLLTCGAVRFYRVAGKKEGPALSLRGTDLKTVSAEG
jgi:ubiquinone/menaquinone biosynthesis C-methylase UbiE